MAGPTLSDLDHVILAVRDLEQATARYARLLGRSPSWRGEHPGGGTANTLFRLDNTYVELLAPHGEGGVGQAVGGWIETHGEGLLGLAFGTRDAEACRAGFVERGLSPGPVEKGLGRDVGSGGFREWLRVPLPGSDTRGVLLFAIEHTTAEDALPAAAPLGDAKACVFGLDHAVVQTADAEAAKALYGDALGLRLAVDHEIESWGVRLLFFKAGDVTIEVGARLPSAQGRPAPGDLPEWNDDTGRDKLWGLSFQVADADAARARLAAAGFDVSEVRAGRRPGTRVCSVRDGTCGVPTLMIEPASRPPGSPRATTGSR